MAALPKRIVRRGVLKRAARPLLARLLAPLDAYLAAHDFDRTALARSLQDDRDLPRRLVRLDTARRLPRSTHGDEDLARVALDEADGSSA
jgi:hypothetical protein